MRYADFYPELIKAHRATNERVKRLLGGGTTSATTLALRAIKPVEYLAFRPKGTKGTREVVIGETRYLDTPRGLRKVGPVAAAAARTRTAT